ncbi:MAG: aminodeoxychorismate lyase, partial [Gammaproteobacteria bacterium]|nr:aminodeoxychorismate lyase [Gammaproteobacteria bacterium]
MNRILINGQASDTIPVYDRAFQYGDGLFETIAFRNGQLIYWREHLQRFNYGCDALALPVVPEKTWLADLEQLIDRQQDCVVKLIYSRGNGQRGYTIPDPPAPLRSVMVSAMPGYSPDLYQQGAHVKICKTPASINSRLAGIKHLNKLENILARNEWSDKTVLEGIMLDDIGNVIEGTMTNVFGVKEGALYTPILKRSGVNGIIRQRVIDLAKAAGVVTQQIEIKLEKLF